MRGTPGSCPSSACRWWSCSIPGLASASWTWAAATGPSRLRGDQIARFPRPTPLPGDLLDWLATFAGSFTATVPEGERRAFLQEVQEALHPVLCDAQGVWTVDYVRLRFAATKPV